MQLNYNGYLFHTMVVNMALNDRENFWSIFFGLPRENESYLFYFASLKFILAPIANMISFVVHGIFNFFAPQNPLTISPEPEDGELEVQKPIRNAALYEHKSMTTSASSDQEMVNPQQLLEAFEMNSFSDGLGNTSLTAFLAYRVFNERTVYIQFHQQKLLSVLTQLCQIAQTSPTAKKLLTTPNNPVEYKGMNVASGIPINTPLMLLVKAGDSEGVKLLLPFYSAEELMITTPRGNSVFHIASITGQSTILTALMQRARELGIENVYQEHTNLAGYTAYQLFIALCQTKNYFQNLLDFSAPYLGGEEINKAAVSDSGASKVFVARRGAFEFRKLFDETHPAKEEAEDTNSMSLNNAQ
jgi:hypothetical protein